MRRWQDWFTAVPLKALNDQVWLYIYQCLYFWQIIIFNFVFFSEKLTCAFLLKGNIYELSKLYTSLSTKHYYFFSVQQMAAVSTPHRKLIYLSFKPRKWQYLSQYCSDKCFKGTIVNRVMPSVYCIGHSKLRMYIVQSF